MPGDVDIHPASTVALLRDGPRGIETLLLRRSGELAFAADRWVFPGGRLEDADRAAVDGGEDAAARCAAARESVEECGLRPEPRDMLLLSRWTTPVGHPRRFSTYIFAAPLADTGEVVVDGGEISDYCWLAAAEALAAHREGELDVLPPTMITLRLLARYGSVADFVQAAGAWPVPEIFPVLCKTPAGPVSMYPGDAGYAAADPALPGPRHRSVFTDNHWVYTYQGVDPAYPPLAPLD